MKKIIFTLLVLASGLVISAQGIDSSQLLINISLTKDQHKHVIRCLGTNSLSSPERFNYVTDLLKAGFKTKIDTDTISVSVPARLVSDAFREASMRSEGVVLTDNANTQAALLPQVQGSANRWVRNEILSTKADNAQRNQQEKDAVEQYMQRLKKP
jgi:hypothetical protein